MEIGHKFEFVEGNFETKTGKLVAVPYQKYNEVLIAIKSNMNIPITKVKLYSRDLAIDAEEVFEDASKLAKEIVRRYNEFPEHLKQ